VRERVAVRVLHEGDHVIAVEFADVRGRAHAIEACILAVRRIHAHVCLVAFVHPVECLALLFRDGFVTNVVRSGRRAAEAEDCGEGEEEGTSHGKPPIAN